MIVAEIGVNWNWENLGRRMSRIRETGAQWVKGQLFYPDQVPEQFEPVALCRRTDIDRFKDAARNADLIPIFTPMHIDLVRFCDRGHIKVRYLDGQNSALIRASEDTASNVWVSGKNVLCVPKYPATIQDYMDYSGGNPSYYLGLSSHIPELSGVFEVISDWKRFSRNPNYIEAHVKFSEDDPEAAWSLSCEDFKRLVEWERNNG